MTAAFRLEQNYPNPFDPKTVLGFRVPSFGMVTLKVFDLLGREVAVLVNEERTAGRYEVTWHASGMASGVYLYTLRAGEFMQTRRLILLR